MENIQVAIRIRPFLHNESSAYSSLTTDESDDRKICVAKDLHYFEAFYDKVFFQSSTQEEMYAFVAPGINQSKQSFINCTVIAYGQTGSGKTFTMFGSDWTKGSSFTSSSSYDYLATDNATPKAKRDKFNFIQNVLYIDPFSQFNGLIPRILQNIFHRPKYKVACSYIQIYNERIYDLLLQEDSTAKKKEKFTTIFGKGNTTVNPISQKPLSIREDKSLGLIINNITEYQPETLYDCFALLKEGEKNRKTRQTNKNELSSRSHTVFLLSLFRENDKGEITHRSKIHLCDLAGSEKYDIKGSYSQLHKNELVNINLSLAALGNVIHALVNNSSHVPYRDSKITRILQDSLGGRTKTYIIATVSPSIASADETISTLKFADRAHSVFCRVEPNEITLGTEGSQNLIQKLATELSALKEAMHRKNRYGNDPHFEELFLLREENEELKRYVMTNDPLQRLINENRLLKSEIKKISKSAPWTQQTTSYKDKDTEREYSNVKPQESKQSIKYLPFNNAGNEIVYGNKKSQPGVSPREITASEVTDINKRISKVKNNLKRLDEIEKDNHTKTQMLIDDILKRSKRKDH